MKELNYLARRLGVSTSSLRKSLTHYTFYDDKNNPDSNSRYVFAGMFVFRGILAETLYKLVPASGTQLQHALGNMFSNEKLSELFDELKLNQLIRAGENFDVKNHKHIFAFGLLGCIAMECKDEDVRGRFISKHFILPSEHILNHKPKNRDLRTQADELAKQMVGKALVVTTSENNGIFVTQVYTKDGNEIARAESKSYRYSRTKALKFAIRLMSEELMYDFDKNSDYYSKLIERSEKEKEEKLNNRVKAEEEKRKHKAERVLERKRIAAEKDAARRKAQAEAKERRKRKAAIEAKKAAKEAKPMSAGKRRHLEDKSK